MNLYFTASVDFGFFSVELDDLKPVACYTYWNYQCGTEVTLYTASPFAPLCAPCAPVDAPENYVLFRAIGNVPLSGIYGSSTLLTLSATSANIGLAANLYGAGLDSPFGNPPGDAIYPRIEFDGSLRNSNLATYYQLSYRQGTSGSFTPLTGIVNRKYNHFVGATLVTSVYNLGPQVVNGVPNLFEIPPDLPPPGGDWAFPDPPVDLANGVLDTSGFPAPGTYQLQLELFDMNGAVVNIGAAGIGYFVPTTEDPDGTIHTANASTLGLVSGNSFIMTLHVDNRPTSGSLSAPLINGSPADACGVLHYSSGTGGLAGTVTIQYTATQPGKFATYSYRLSRGVTPLTPPTTSGQTSAATNPAIVTMSALSLLTQPDQSVCDVAGFGEDLYVASLTTDGWNRVSDYDSDPPPVGFVLAP